MRSKETDYEKMAEKWKPENIKILFVAESPPKPKDDELPYFYNTSTDFRGLSMEMSKALEINGEKKEEFLKKFEEKGFFLVDIFPTHEQFKKFEKNSMKCYKKTIERFSKIVSENKPDKIIFICKRAAGLLSLPYPGFGHQKDFKKIIKKTL